MSTQFAPIWNNASVDFTCIKANVTDSNSGSNSTLLDLQVGGTSKVKVDKSGTLIIGNQYTWDDESLIKFGPNSAAVNFNLKVGSGNSLWFTHSRTALGIASRINGVDTNPTLVLRSDGKLGWATGTSVPTESVDLFLQRDAANTLALRRANTAGPTTYPQAFRIYNSVDGTDSAPGSNWERAKIAWESNVLRIGTEKLGTGAARALEFQTDGTTRLTIGTDGALTGGVSTWTSTTGSIDAVRLQGNATQYLTGLVATNAATARFRVRGIKSRGTLTAPRRVKTGDSLFSIETVGHYAADDSTNSTQGNINFQINVTANEDYTSTAQSSSCVFSIGKQGETGSVNEMLRLDWLAGANRRIALFDETDIAVGTTTGTKIATSTTQKLGFYNSTPVVQPAAVADATDAASVITQLNLLLARMRDLGLIAT